MGLDEIPYGKWISGAAWLLRKLHLQRVVAVGREVACRGMLKRYHIDVFHRMRQLALVQDVDSDIQNPPRIAQEVCTECRRLLGSLLEVGPNHLHCCIKVFVDPETDGGSVATWVRSEPADDRPAQIGREQAHRVRHNTVWAVLLGETDGNTQWTAHRAFCCNDLTRHAGLFKCSRDDWKKYYKSTLALPMRLPVNPQKNEYDVIGFLTFDSPLTGVFRKVPNIFEYLDQTSAEYSEELESSMAFHAAGILADTLGIFVRSVVNRQNPARSEP